MGPPGGLSGNSAIGNRRSRIRIGTRGSALALAQTGHVAEAIAAACPGLTYELVRITTTGDRRTKESLPEIGGKGLFTKELEDALLRGDIDLAVHSLKDLPTELPEGLAIAAIPPRAPANDALIVPLSPLPRGEGRVRDDGGGVSHPAKGSTPAPASPTPPLPPRERKKQSPGPIALLPEGAVVGTGSPRRAAQLLHLRPDLRPTPIRGNLDTRLRKLQEGQFDAIVLALAGLVRLGIVRIEAPVGRANLHAEPIIAGANTSATEGCVCRFAHPTIELDGFAVCALPFDVMLPAPGQGALAVEIRADNAPLAELIARITHPPTVAATVAERALLAALGGGCQLPLGAYAEIEGDTLHLRAILLSPDGSNARRADRTGSASDPHACAHLAASDLQPL